ncbi:MAG: YabP/YqfC family sporulation protein [Ruminococcus sp.]
MGKNKRDKQKNEGSKLSLSYSVRDAFRDKPHIEIVGNKTVSIEGSRGVIEYSESVIRVNLGEYSVAFSGRGMNLKYISPTSLAIEGFILNIEFAV